MVGGFHHQSIYVSAANPPASPSDLVGQRVGIRSYSQTTGLWARAILEEEYGVRPTDVTWVTTEGSHSDAFVDPPNVERSTEPIEDALQSGSISAAILGRQADKAMVPIIPNPREAAAAWYERHGVVPINHMVVTTLQLATSRPAFVRAVYRALADEVDATRASRESPSRRLPTATAYGIERVRAGVELAASYALTQALISKAPDVDSLFVPPDCYTD
jgi:4,5-dihydroxyphthalate decarboxylase